MASKASGEQTSAETTAAAAPTDEGTLVEFVGVKPYGREFHKERSISKKEFDAVNINASQDYSFKPENGWKQRVPQADGDVLDYFSKDESFKVRSDS